MPRGGKRDNPGGRPKSENPRIYSVLLKTTEGTFSRKLTADEADKVKDFIEKVRSEKSGN